MEFVPDEVGTGYVCIIERIYPSTAIVGLLTPAVLEITKLRHAARLPG